MKARIRHPYPLSPKNVSSFSVLGVLLGRFSSVLQHIWISEITARAGALQLWREPSKEVTWLAAKSRKNNLSNSTQEAKAGGSKKCHGLCKPKAETQVESLRMGWEGWPPDEGKGKAELLVWSWESSGRRTRGTWGGPCWGRHTSKCLLLRWNQKIRVLVRDGDAHPRELLLSHSSCPFGEGHAPKYQQRVLLFSRYFRNRRCQLARSK